MSEEEEGSPMRDYKRRSMGLEIGTKERSISLADRASNSGARRVRARGDVETVSPEELERQ